MDLRGINWTTDVVESWPRKWRIENAKEMGRRSRGRYLDEVAPMVFIDVYWRKYQADTEESRRNRDKKARRFPRLSRTKTRLM